jgi:hypothetical protein
MVRGVRTPPQARLHPIVLIEDRESIQASLMEVINALIRNHIDTKRAELNQKPLTYEEQLSRIPKTPPRRIDPTHAKPPESVKQTDAVRRRSREAPKEQKIAGHRASGG